MSEGFYSLVRYTPDTARGEARNVAVFLVDEKRNLAMVKAAPLAQVARRIEEHGILDSLLVRFAERVQAGEFRRSDEVNYLARSVTGALTVTVTRPAAIEDRIDVTLNHLYKAFVRPRRGRDRISRSVILDRLVRACRRAHVHVEPGAYIRDVMFDAVLTDPDRVMPIQVLTFETSGPRNMATEHAAGHFLYGLQRVKASGVCVVQAPSDMAVGESRLSFDRVSRWLEDAGVGMVTPADIGNLARTMAGNENLPLVMTA